MNWLRKLVLNFLKLTVALIIVLGVAGHIRGSWE